MSRSEAEIRADLEHPHTAALTALHSTTIGDGPIGRLLRDVEPLLAELDRLREITERLAGERADALDELEESNRVIHRPEDLAEWFTAYGIQLSTVGEDGDWIALGHVEPRRMLAAMRKAARNELGLSHFEVFGETGEFIAGLLRSVKHSRAYFTNDESGEHGWFAHWGEDAQKHPAAVDITTWEA